MGIFVVVVIITIIVAILINATEEYQKTSTEMSFREAMELTDLPIVTFKIGDRKLHFLLDTGSNKSIINEKIANKLNATLTEGDTQVFGIDGNLQKCQMTSLKLSYRGEEYEEEFQVLDMSAPFKRIKGDSGVTLHGIIGNKFMEKYKYILDFARMAAYSKQA